MKVQGQVTMYKYTENPSVIAGPNGNLIRVGNDNPEYVALVQSGATIEPWMPPAPTREMVQDERARRLALGFDYEFGDARGVHHIGTSADDMTGWRDVIDYANALIDSGDTTTQIAIVTDTGATMVTAPEWQAIMLAAAEVRQILWARSFALQAANPIPQDYTDDSHWT